MSATFGGRGANTMQTIIFMAIADDHTIIAHFAKREHCVTFCHAHQLCELPFNLANRHNEAPPMVGSKYTP